MGSYLLDTNHMSTVWEKVEAHYGKIGGTKGERP
jgi:hypothetical protein